MSARVLLLVQTSQHLHLMRERETVVIIWVGFFRSTLLLMTTQMSMILLQLSKILTLSMQSSRVVHNCHLMCPLLTWELTVHPKRIIVSNLSPQAKGLKGHYSYPLALAVLLIKELNQYLLSLNIRMKVCLLLQPTFQLKRQNLLLLWRR